MASAFKVKPSHKPVKSYYAALATYADQSVEHEGALRSAFQNLLAETGRKVGWTLIPPSQPAEFDLQPTGMFKFPQAHGDQPRRCGRRDPWRAPRPLADVGALRRAAGAGTFRGVANQGRHVIRGGYNHDVEMCT